MRQPKPWFRKQTKSWYVQLGRKQVNLGRDKKMAWEKYYEIMSGSENGALVSDVKVQQILEYYLEWCERNLEPPTFKKNRFHIRRFAQRVSGDLALSQLKPLHVQKWVDEQYSGKSDTYKNIAITTIKAAMNWAADQGYTEHNPISRIKKPRPKVREFFILSSEWDCVLQECRGEQFKEFVIVLLSTGARPQELRRVEARHYDGRLRRFVLERNESKGKRTQRVIYLDDTACLIVEQLIGVYSKGPIFRNSRGGMWTNDAICSRFRRLKRKLNIPQITAYTLRHSFAHWRLTTGTDSHMVSKLLGHTDGRMLETRYGHVERNAQFLYDQVRKTRSPFEDQH